MNIFVICLALTSVSFMGVNAAPSFWDAVPVVSQGKMAFLYIIGDNEEAEQTWNNFKSLTHLWESVKDIDNTIPGYGHIKSAIVAMNGDSERALNIFKTAQKSTFIMGGFFLAGPPGAIGGAVTADAMHSVVFRQPEGVIEHALHFENKSMGENVDAVLDLVFYAAGGKAQVAGLSKTVRIGMQKIADTRRPSHVSAVSSVSGMTEMLEIIKPIPRERLESQSSTLKELAILEINDQRRQNKKPI